jgi:hypothetical protein
VLILSAFFFASKSFTAVGEVSKIARLDEEVPYKTNASTGST